MICGSCAMRIDGATVLACKMRMSDVRGGGERAGDLADGQPADRQGPRRRHGAVLGQVPRRRPVPAARLHRAARRPRARDLAAADGRDPQGVALHQLRRLRLGVQRDGVEPGVPRAAGAREGDALRRRPPRRREERAARGAERRARDLGVHPLLLLQRALPEGRRPARRDREARRRVDQGGDRPRHGREAREVVRHLGEDDGLAARDRARAEDAGHRRVDQADEVRARPRQDGQGADRRSRRTSRRTCASRAGSTTCCTSRIESGFAGIVQGEKALAKLAHGHHDERARSVRPGLVPAAVSPEERGRV